MFNLPQFNQPSTPGVNNNMKGLFQGWGSMPQPNMRQPNMPNPNQQNRPGWYPMRDRTGRTIWRKYRYSDPHQSQMEQMPRIMPGGVPDISQEQLHKLQVPTGNFFSGAAHLFDGGGAPQGMNWSGAGQISTGIGVNPVSQQAIQQGGQWIANQQAPQSYEVPALQQALQDAMGSMGASAGLGFERAATPANQNYQLAAEQARANAGLGWGGLQNQQFGADLGRQGQIKNALLQLLGMFA